MCWEEEEEEEKTSDANFPTSETHLLSYTRNYVRKEEMYHTEKEKKAYT